MPGNLLTTLPTLGKEWRMSYDFKPKNYHTGVYANSLHLTIGENKLRHGDRAPAIFARESSMIVDAAIDGETFVRFHVVPPPLGTWTTLVLSQTLEGEKYMFRTSLGGPELLARHNTLPMEFHSVQVFASSPWDVAQEGRIRNLVIETKPTV